LPTGVGGLPIKFLHLADIHLGYEQYGLRERERDLAKAFLRALTFACEKDVDFVIVAGDIFHQRSIDPATLITAVEVLQIARDAGIPVIAVAGNHDRAWEGRGYSWLSFLHHLGYLTLLDAVIEQGTLKLQPPDSLQPSYAEFGDVRVIGLPYLGAALPRIMDQLPDAISDLDRKYTILMTHAGLEGEMPGLSMPLRHEHLESVHPWVDYVALGHLHKPFQREGWIYNPGSMEALAADEVQYRGGWCLVEVSRTGPASWQHSVETFLYDRRPFRRVTMEVGFYETPAQLEQAVANLAQDNSDLLGQGALLELTLKGMLPFLPSSLDLNRLSQILEEKLQLLKVLVRNRASPRGGPSIQNDGASRPEMERRAIARSLIADSRYAANADTLAQTAVELKELATAGEDDEVVFDHVLTVYRSLNDGTKPLAHAN